MHAYLIRPCAICGKKTPTRKVVTANIDINKLNEKIFSARRIPDHLTFQWVTCDYCGLYIASPYISIDLESLYSKSVLNYGKELNNLKITYKKLLKSCCLNQELKKLNFLDVGAGNGFVLEVARQMGFGSTKGIEPSEKVVNEASIEIREELKIGFLSNDSYDPDSLDVISMFHVLDHLAEPNDSLKQCHNFLKANGIIVIAVHNSNSFSRYLLRSRSPIFDIEHTYLFNKSTLRKMLQNASFEVVFVKSYWNRYSIGYLISLLPLGKFKLKIIKFLSQLNVANLPVWVPLGNIYVFGRKIQQNS